MMVGFQERVLIYSISPRARAVAWHPIGLVTQFMDWVKSILSQLIYMLIRFIDKEDQ